MSFWTCVIAVMNCIQLQSAYAEPQAPPARLQGTVVDAVTDQPLQNLNIRLRGTFLEAVTDFDGRFVLGGIPPGSYILTTERAGYMQVRAAGRKLPERTGLPLILEDGELRRESIRLYPAAIVSGRIFDDMGSPIPNAVVVPFRRSFDEDGRPALKFLAAGKPDDLGQFRFNTVEAGEYGFRITPPSSSRQDALTPSLTFSTIYYPNEAEPKQAAIMRVEAGQQLRLDDAYIRTMRGHVVRYHVVDETSKVLSVPAAVSLRRVGDTEIIHGAATGASVLGEFS